MNLRISSTDWLAAMSSGAGRRVDAVVAGVHRRRRRDAHVHLARAGLPDHLHDLARRRPAHDRVVDEDDALALDDFAHRVQLHLDAEVPDRLLGLDERAADVVVAHEARARTGCPTPRRSRAPRTCRSPAPARRRRPRPGAPAPGGGRSPGARSGHAAAEDHRVRPREVDVLEDAGRRDRKREAVRGGPRGESCTISPGSTSRS